MLEDEADTMRRQLRAVRYAHALLLEDLAQMAETVTHKLLRFETGRPPEFTGDELARLRLVLDDLAPVGCSPAPGDRSPA